MFGKLFGRNKEDNWEITIKCGDMIRKHQRTGELEYRDCTGNRWIPINELSEIDTLKEHGWATLDMPLNAK